MGTAASVQFCDGEPLWVDRSGEYGPAVHAKVAVAGLSRDATIKLAAWLAVHDIEVPAEGELIVTTDMVDDAMPAFLRR